MLGTYSVQYDVQSQQSAWVLLKYLFCSLPGSTQKLLFLALVRPYLISVSQVWFASSYRLSLPLALPVKVFKRKLR